MLRRVLVNSRHLTQRSRISKQCSRSYDADDRTTVKVLNQETDAGLMIDCYSQVGFSLNNGMSLIGPIAIFPKTVLSWCVTNSHDINEDSLSLFYLLEPKIVAANGVCMYHI
ncbi:hypothetical protein OTU49_014024 [Cherax quadricarinatus]|uniref:Uncharacterized protein n=1 Tax=Cherax quadricarinatus TaxID=27406 RepID=A0AAW0VQA0_CHEQU